ncbi:MAG: hypothetical protein B2I17_00020 [Thermoplasmatales archaeon B_DKE]|nr:MAG: hypothetical protein B2I17_00020 [Thermoplasmatales archaeon B_DKE]
MVVRDSLEIKAPPEEVYSFLVSLSLNRLKVSRKIPEIKTVIFSSGMSLFSWGESVEASVQASQTGSLVVLRAQAKFQLNITAHPESLSRRVKDALKGEFG